MRGHEARVGHGTREYEGARAETKSRNSYPRVEYYYYTDPSITQGFPFLLIVLGFGFR